ncbi:hypothetical protein SDJN02_27275, partial [Cucurbita argyrosperma subsp. argyrosperma]
MITSTPLSRFGKTPRRRRKMLLRSGVCFGSFSRCCEWWSSRIIDQSLTATHALNNDVKVTVDKFRPLFYITRKRPRIEPNPLMILMGMLSTLILDLSGTSTARSIEFGEYSL